MQVWLTSEFQSRLLTHIQDGQVLNDMQVQGLKSVGRKDQVSRVFLSGLVSAMTSSLGMI